MLGDVLRIEHLSKTFPGQVALSDVDLDVAAGEVHALVGQNGSGKSTLIKVLAGYHQPDPGAPAWVNGDPLTSATGTPRLRRASASCTRTSAWSAPQRGREPGAHRRLSHRLRAGGSGGARSDGVTRQALADLGLEDVDVRSPIDALPPAQRTSVAIARALVGLGGERRLLILDEPTATLPGDDVRRLFEVIHRLKAKGVSILYVSHHLDEVFELADRVTVFRDGRRVATRPVKGLDHDGLIELIVGHRLETHTATEATTLWKAGAVGPRVAR